MINHTLPLDIPIYFTPGNITVHLQSRLLPIAGSTDEEIREVVGDNFHLDDCTQPSVTFPGMFYRACVNATNHLIPCGNQTNLSVRDDVFILRWTDPALFTSTCLDLMLEGNILAAYITAGKTITPGDSLLFLGAIYQVARFYTTTTTASGCALPGVLPTTPAQQIAPVPMSALRDDSGTLPPLGRPVAMTPDWNETSPAVITTTVDSAGAPETFPRLTATITSKDQWTMHADVALTQAGETRVRLAGGATFWDDQTGLEYVLDDEVAINGSKAFTTVRVPLATYDQRSLEELTEAATPIPASHDWRTTVAHCAEIVAQAQQAGSGMTVTVMPSTPAGKAPCEPYWATNPGQAPIPAPVMISIKNSVYQVKYKFRAVLDPSGPLGVGLAMTDSYGAGYPCFQCDPRNWMCREHYDQLYHGLDRGAEWRVVTLGSADEIRLTNRLSLSLALPSLARADALTVTDEYSPSASAGGLFTATITEGLDRLQDWKGLRDTMADGALLVPAMVPLRSLTAPQPTGPPPPADYWLWAAASRLVDQCGQLDISDKTFSQVTSRCQVPIGTCLGEEPLALLARTQLGNLPLPDSARLHGRIVSQSAAAGNRSRARLEGFPEVAGYPVPAPLPGMDIGPALAVEMGHRTVRVRLSFDGAALKVREPALSATSLSYVLTPSSAPFHEHEAWLNGTVTNEGQAPGALLAELSCPTVGDGAWVDVTQKIGRVGPGEVAKFSLPLAMPPSNSSNTTHSCALRLSFTSQPLWSAQAKALTQRVPLTLFYGRFLTPCAMRRPEVTLSPLDVETGRTQGVTDDVSFRQLGGDALVTVGWDPAYTLNVRSACRRLLVCANGQNGAGREGTVRLAVSPARDVIDAQSAVPTTYTFLPADLPTGPANASGYVHLCAPVGICQWDQLEGLAGRNRTVAFDVALAAVTPTGECWSSVNKTLTASLEILLPAVLAAMPQPDPTPTPSPAASALPPWAIYAMGGGSGGLVAIASILITMTCAYSETHPFLAQFDQRQTGSATRYRILTWYVAHAANGTHVALSRLADSSPQYPVIISGVLVAREADHLDARAPPPTTLPGRGVVSAPVRLTGTFALSRDGDGDDDEGDAGRSIWLHTRHGTYLLLHPQPQFRPFVEVWLRDQREGRRRGGEGRPEMGDDDVGGFDMPVGADGARGEADEEEEEPQVALTATSPHGGEVKGEASPLSRF
ncbi:hypothetical protein PAPYR_2471 [Paratrimastix pyriformis]|uniref:Uncharacterized protein n=1 Tax=Paratrimastix pyriformis TaxID=342808 RepID=A0ABQ8UQB7_9EUKA|nr:hypothetical protein PAPYR_2471 [Paratrimastix pyriformis]